MIVYESWVFEKKLFQTGKNLSSLYVMLSAKGVRWL